DHEAFADDGLGRAPLPAHTHHDPRSPRGARNAHNRAMTGWPGPLLHFIAEMEEGGPPKHAPVHRLITPHAHTIGYEILT
ncbi:hypothetical protein LCGC14_3034700, partial [marine sediment metagenome]